MQLFGLVNKLLATDNECFKRHLDIERFPVIPLSPNSALLGWVPGADTLNMLIREYRDSRKILVNIEQRLMMQMAPDYDILTLLQKVEVFEYALDNTTGHDLWKVLWLRSKSSEAWLDRRTNYARSLAVMSMVGYILGLGDRHPSNLMLDRNSGKIVHIDFGDCFEVAMQRDKYPETVPFRLTRMLVNAMEVNRYTNSVADDRYLALKGPSGSLASIQCGCCEITKNLSWLFWKRSFMILLSIGNLPCNPPRQHRTML